MMSETRISAFPSEPPGWKVRYSSAVKPRFLIARNENGAIAGVMPAYLSRGAISRAHVTTFDAGILAAHPDAGARLVEC